MTKRDWLFLREIVEGSEDANRHFEAVCLRALNAELAFWSKQQTTREQRTLGEMLRRGVDTPTERHRVLQEVRGELGELVEEVQSRADLSTIIASLMSVDEILEYSTRVLTAAVVCRAANELHQELVLPIGHPLAVGKRRERLERGTGRLNWRDLEIRKASGMLDVVPRDSDAEEAEALRGLQQLNVGAKQPVDQRSVLGDWRAGFEMLESGALDEFRGQFVAILNSKVVDSGSDQSKLRKAVARATNVEEERVVVMYVDDGEYVG